MSQTSKINVKIGCDGTQYEDHCQAIDFTFTINQAKLTQYTKTIQKQLQLKRVPILTIQFNQKQGHKMPNTGKLFGCQFQFKQKIVGEKRILYGDVKMQQTLLFVKKLQRVLSNITQCQTNLNLKFKFYNIESKDENSSLVQLFDKVKIQGAIKIDDKTPNLIKKSLIKVSPKFIQSPIFLFFELFNALDFKLDLHSLHELEQASSNKLLQTFFELKKHNQDLSKFIKEHGKQPIKFTFCVEKLMTFQFVGPSTLLAKICQFL